jgi:NADH dehydrogenase subunit 3
MTELESFARLGLIPIVIIFLKVKVSGEKHFKIASVSLLFVIFLKFFFFDYNDFPITKMVYLFLALYALQLLFEWDKLLKLMGVIPDSEE